MKWEYLRRKYTNTAAILEHNDGRQELVTSASDDLLADDLFALGLEGWELAAVIDANGCLSAIFKKPAAETAEKPVIARPGPTSAPGRKPGKGTPTPPPPDSVRR